MESNVIRVLNLQLLDLSNTGNLGNLIANKLNASLSLPTKPVKGLANLIKTSKNLH